MKLKTINRKTSVTRNAVKKAISEVVQNKYKVPEVLWRKFKTNGQKVFNDVMEQSLKNQSITVHPKTKLPNDEWKTICHNMACYAAWSVSKNKLVKGDTVIDISDKGEETKRRKVA